MSMKTLDTVIALIIVILLLSLVVQSLQAVIKKWFKLKSKTIHTSLVELFDYVKTQDLAGVESTWLAGEVKRQFGLLGKLSLFKNPMMDSIAKTDLLKILGEISIKNADAEKVDALKQKVDEWFETVMQGFEERYTRHMKTVALCVSIVVVIVLNANFFDIYHNISTNDSLRETVIARRGQIEERLKQLSSEDPTKVTQEDIDKAIKELKGIQGEEEIFGIMPLSTSDVSDFYNVTGPWAGSSRSTRFWYVIKLLVGWSITVMLLSVGAPFWQDTLESLFGIKNLLRSRTDTKNVEDTGGQPKP
jgi:hypothetical protein